MRRILAVAAALVAVCGLTVGCCGWGHGCGHGCYSHSACCATAHCPGGMCPTCHQATPAAK